MNITAKEIVNLIKGEIIGNESVEVSSVSKIEDGNKGDLCFLANPKYSSYVYSSKASIIIVDKKFKEKKNLSSTLIKVEDPYSAFGKVLKLFNQVMFDNEGLSEKANIHKTTKIGNKVFIDAFNSIGKNVCIGKNVKIYSNCSIGDNTCIGDNTIIFPGVTIYHNCKIGANNILHSGVVIGADGFGFAPDNNVNYSKIYQIGNVITEDDVEIGANTTIDRATMGSTKIGKGVKLDNLIQIAHNVEIGSHTVIAAQTAIAGSTRIGEKCMIGGQTAISGHLVIADEVKIAGQSGIVSNITKKGSILQGPMAFDIKKFQKSYVIFKKLPEIYKNLEKQIK